MQCMQGSLFQMTLETSLTRVEKNQEDVQAEVLEAVSILEDLKGQTATTEVKLNFTHKAIQQHIQVTIRCRVIILQDKS